MATETILKKFNINLLTEGQYEEAKALGTLSEDEIYLIQGEDDALLKSGGIMTGTLTLASDPTDNLHAATKQYVDNLIGVILNGAS